MNSYEKDEIRQLPDKYRPLGAWGYFGYTILFSIPLIGFICLIVFSFSDRNMNRRSFARSYFCGLILVLILFVVIVVMAGGFGAIAAYIQQLKPAN